MYCNLIGLNYKCIPQFYDIPVDVIRIIGDYLNEHEANILSILTSVKIINDNPCEKCNYISTSKWRDIELNMENIKSIKSLGLKFVNNELLINDFKWKKFNNKKIYIKLTEGISNDIGWRISKFLSKNISCHDLKENNSSFKKTLNKYSNKIDSDRPLFFRNYEEKDNEFFNTLFTKSINPILVSSYIIDFNWLDKFDYLILSRTIDKDDLFKIYVKYFSNNNPILPYKIFENIYKKLKNLFILDLINIKIYNC